MPPLRGARPPETSRIDHQDGCNTFRHRRELQRARLAARVPAVTADGGTGASAAGIGVFRSLRQPETRRAFAAEMRRVLRPDGLIVWYEFRVDNPRNPDVKAVTLAELRLLFPDCDCAFGRTILAPAHAASLSEMARAL